MRSLGSSMLLLSAARNWHEDEWVQHAGPITFIFSIQCLSWSVFGGCVVVQIPQSGTFTEILLCAPSEKPKQYSFWPLGVAKSDQMGLKGTDFWSYRDHQGPAAGVEASLSIQSDFLASHSHNRTKCKCEELRSKPNSPDWAHFKGQETKLKWPLFRCFLSQAAHSPDSTMALDGS